jgi:4-hydroxy 2-oxovalerate aldolase
MGMGKGAGNLNTELLLEHLNIYYGKSYKIEPLLEVMDKVINQLHSEFYWGYSPEYYLSSANHCTPSYASHFYNKHMLPIDQVGELLSMIPEDKKISFDMDFAEDLYRQYNERKSVDDTQTVDELKGEITGKKLLLIAPGKNLSIAEKKIKDLITEKEVLSIGLNVVGKYDVDYFLITRKDLYEEAVSNGKKVITTSAITKGGRGNVYVLNYKNWININGNTHDSSVVIAFNLLNACDVKHIMLAGFDGFSTDINENYFDPNMRYPVNSKQKTKYNSYNKNLIMQMRDKGVCVDFITPSKYE